jgi:uncharacterized membrane protein YeaQ/YmgE (transglycosylase-associated protein family)
MSATVINLIIQLISGAVGGNAAGKINKGFDIGTLGNTIAGAAGGVGGGYLLSTLLPNLIQAAEGGGLDIGAIASQAVGGGVAGLVLTAIIGFIKNKAAA